MGAARMAGYDDSDTIFIILHGEANKVADGDVKISKASGVVQTGSLIIIRSLPDRSSGLKELKSRRAIIEILRRKTITSACTFLVITVDTRIRDWRPILINVVSKISSENPNSCNSFLRERIFTRVFRRVVFASTNYFLIIIGYWFAIFRADNAFGRARRHDNGVVSRKRRRIKSVRNDRWPTRPERPVESVSLPNTRHPGG